MKKILEKINDIREKETLHAVRKMILQEYKKDYYMNAANVKERIELNSEVVEYGINKKYYRVENMWIWGNNFITFDHNNFTITGLSFPQKNKKFQEKRK